MSLPFLYSAPANNDDWESWAFNHAANHNDIVFNVGVQKNNYTLQQFVLDPVNPDDLGDWLYQHQVMHNQANAALGTSGYDLVALDWKDPEQFAWWLRLNADEHVRLSAALNIG